MKTIFGVIGTLIIGILLGIVMMIDVNDDGDYVKVVVRQDTVVMRDTVMMKAPMARDSVVTKYVTRYVEVRSSPELDTLDDEPREEKNSINEEETQDDEDIYVEVVSGSDGGVGRCKGCDEQQLMIDHLPMNNDVIIEVLSGGDGGVGRQRKTVAVNVPITQKVYEDSLYKAWVSGYEARLDSIRLYGKTAYVERETVLRENRGTQGLKRWGCVAGVGAGVTIMGRLEPMAGVTVGYRLW